VAAPCIFCRSPSNVPRKHCLAWDISLSWQLACVLMRLYLHNRVVLWRNQHDAICNVTHLQLFSQSDWSVGVLHLRRYVQIGSEVHVVSCPIYTNLFSWCFRDGSCSYLSWGLTCLEPYFCVHVRLQFTFRESYVHNKSHCCHEGCMATVRFSACEPEFYFLSQSVKTEYPALRLL
jgi:hypothetical protein